MSATSYVHIRGWLCVYLTGEWLSGAHDRDSAPEKLGRSYLPVTVSYLLAEGISATSGSNSGGAEIALHV